MSKKIKRILEILEGKIKVIISTVFLVVPIILVRLMDSPGIVRLSIYSLLLVLLSCVLLYLGFVPGSKEWYVVPVFDREINLDSRHYVLSVILRVSSIIIIFSGLLITAYNYSHLTMDFVMNRISPVELDGYKRGEGGSIVALLVDRFRINDGANVYTYVYPAYYKYEQKYHFVTLSEGDINFILDLRPI